MFTLVEFADRLKVERKARGLNQTAFARLGGVGLQSQSRYENADNEPSAEYLANLAVAGIDVIFILTGERSGELLDSRESELVSLCRSVSADVVDAMMALVRSATRATVRAEHVAGPDAHHALHDKTIDYRAD